MVRHIPGTRRTCSKEKDAHAEIESEDEMYPNERKEKGKKKRDEKKTCRVDVQYIALFNCPTFQTCRHCIANQIGTSTFSLRPRSTAAVGTSSS